MRIGVGKKLYLSVLTTFVLFAASLIVFQQTRERQYKRESLNARLQEHNFRLHEALCSSGRLLRPDSALAQMPEPDLRLTIVRRDGSVEYDSRETAASAMPNHKDRIEIRQAMSTGSGYDYDRMSKTLGRKFFYSATFFPSDSLTFRTALPYDDSLAASLQADQHYLWFAVAVFAILVVILWRFISRLSENISKLQLFARDADRNGGLADTATPNFPNDELGDIAKRIVKLYKRLRETQEQQDTLKRQLTQNIAHELKTPAASIHGYIETLLSNPDMDGATRLQFLERCHAQTCRLASLLQDISTLNKMDDTPSARLRFEPVDISQIVENIGRDTAPQLAERGMRLDNGLPQGIVANGDPSLLYSIFRNLTDNAIAYAGRGARIEIRSRETRSSWYFEFADNGTGVADEHLPRLFERFYRVDRGRSRTMGGTGLGLAIVKNAVLLHGGSINVTNRKGGGLIFLFSIKK